MNKGLKRGLTVSLIVLVLASAGWMAVAEEKKGDKPVPAGKVAEVNGTVITQEDFDRDMAIIQQRMGGMGAAPSDSELAEVKKEVLENLINTELLYQESRKEGKKVEPGELDQQIETLRKRFPSEEAYKLALSKKGLTESDIKKQIERGLSIQKLIDGKFGNLAPTEKETKEYYDGHLDLFKQPEQVRASHILIKVDSSADAAKKAEARKKIEEIQKKLQKGGEFGALAKESSQDGSAANGGDLGFFTKGKMVKPFEDAAFGLNAGQLSGIVETQFGYHLIKVTDKKPERTVPYEEIKAKIESYLKEEKMDKEVRQYIASLKDKSKVDRFMATEEKPEKK